MDDILWSELGNLSEYMNTKAGTELFESLKPKHKVLVVEDGNNIKEKLQNLGCIILAAGPVSSWRLELPVVLDIGLSLLNDFKPVNSYASPKFDRFKENRGKIRSKGRR